MKKSVRMALSSWDAASRKQVLRQEGRPNLIFDANVMIILPKDNAPTRCAMASLENGWETLEQDRIPLPDDKGADGLADHGTAPPVSTMRAGTPATTAPGGTSLVTTAPAATRARSPIVTPEMIVALEPIDAPFLT